MNIFKSIFLAFIILLFSLNVFASASDDVKTDSDDFETTVYEDEVYDPFEGVNRAIFSFNNSADKVVLEPIAKGYKKLDEFRELNQP